MEEEDDYLPMTWVDKGACVLIVLGALVFGVFAVWAVVTAFRWFMHQVLHM